ncbi:amylo-alpha-1,6-glucosidase [Haloimpatiens sp. FM7315]|uniref:amylo-alpha-1,6-glucosidase n=1 Tax=Haloimpatiens sp. FM7315 TaxID=3298609 RepID=UPI0035A3529B
MNINVFEVPFSRYGSYLTISPLEDKNIKRGLYLRSVRGGDEDLGEVFRIETVLNGKPVPYETHCSEVLMELKIKNGGIKLCISEPNLLRIRSEKVNLRLIMKKRSYDNIIRASENSFEVNCSSKRVKFMISLIKGKAFIYRNLEGYDGEIVVDLLDDNGIMEAAIEDYKTVWKEREFESFDASLETVEKDYKSWYNNSLNVPEKYLKGKELASYITWSCVVNPEGILRRRAMYMSKNWMTNIWSWDHCFNAMALTKNNPELAFDQYVTFMDVQDESGAFPDFINDTYALWNYCKPPIHGWTLKWMMERTDYINEDRLKEVYEPLCKWTNWWLKYRDYDKDGIPNYNHGNDSGWDNSTIFKEGMAVESPDLSSFLIIQMDVLSELSKRLNKKEEALNWKCKADKLLNKMIDHFWREDHFVAVDSYTHKDIQSNSLILYLPLILGKRLREDIRKKLISKLKKKGEFLTEFGFATENINSAYYEADGYWRGPIWAPSTMLFVYALKECGEEEFSKEVAKKFCVMANENGMSENYNALTGKTLRDKAFTWTSSVFLVLAKEYIC